MRSIHLRAAVPTDDVAWAFEQIIDFSRYPSLASDVRSVQVHPASASGGPQNTDWEVNFRRGIMRWNEWESFDRDRLRIEFDQTDGDFDTFRGHWLLTPIASGCEVFFEVTYDFGIDSLAGIMDPLAERVIKRAICSVLAGIFGDVTVFEGGQALTDLGELPTSSGVRIAVGEK